MSRSVLAALVVLVVVAEVTQAHFTLSGPAPSREKQAHPSSDQRFWPVPPTTGGSLRSDNGGFADCLRYPRKTVANIVAGSTVTFDFEAGNAAWHVGPCTGVLIDLDTNEQYDLGTTQDCVNKFHAFTAKIPAINCKNCVAKVSVTAMHIPTNPEYYNSCVDLSISGGSGGGKHQSDTVTSSSTTTSSSAKTSSSSSTSSSSTAEPVQDAHVVDLDFDHVERHRTCVHQVQVYLEHLEHLRACVHQVQIDLDVDHCFDFDVNLFNLDLDQVHDHHLHRLRKDQADHDRHHLHDPPSALDPVRRVVVQQQLVVAQARDDRAASRAHGVVDGLDPRVPDSDLPVADGADAVDVHR
ncbi:hypothetical protein BC828DRAFT_396507 [Blastocladiella britannica]|nr:hypothetical protein BC828DRAFT_396507 [Blastocladiella britannica]